MAPEFQRIVAGLFDVQLHASLLGILCYGIGWWRRPIDELGGWRRWAAWGVVFSLIGLISMLSPIEPTQGLRVDIRSTMIVLGLVFGGWPALVIVTLCEALIRFQIGGPMVTPACTGILFGGFALSFAAMGLHLRSGEMNWRKLVILGIIGGTAGPVSYFLLVPVATAWQLALSGGPINILATCLSLLAFAAIIDNTDRSRRNHHALQEREAMLTDNNQQLTDLTVKLERRTQDYAQARDRVDALQNEIRAIFDHSPIGIYVRDLEGRYLALNRPAAAVFNETPENLLGKHAADYVDPRNAPNLIASDRKVLEDNQVHVREFRPVRPDSPHWLWALKFPIKDEAGHIKSIGGFYIDISERKAQQFALEHTVRQLRRMQQISRIIYWYHEIDETGAATRLLGSPDDFFEITGWHAEKVLQGDFFIEHCVHAIDRERMREVYRAFAASEIENYVCEYNLICADGRIMPVKVWVERETATPGTMSERHPGQAVDYYVAGAMQDISEQRQRERQLLDAKSRAEMAGRVKSDFLANLSHELKTPLNAIIGFSDLLKLTLANDTRLQEYLAAINDSGQHLLGIINNLLETAGLDFGAGSISEQMVDIGAVLQGVIDETKTQVNFGDRQIEMLGFDAGIGLFAEGHYLRQAIGNLLNNAVKFTGPEGHITAKISILQSGELEIAIRDDGRGIAAKLIPQLAAPFAYGGNAYTRSHGGVGLGLAMCRKILELHGGRLAIESELGKGSRISLIFPAARVAARGTLDTATVRLAVTTDVPH